MRKYSVAMFYSGNPNNPTAYDPVYNRKPTSDKNVLRPIEYSELLGQSVPGGDRQVNSLKAPLLAAERIHAQDVHIADVLSVPKIVTQVGTNLIIEPGGPSVDFTGHTLINVGGISTDANVYTVNGSFRTTDDVVMVALFVPLANGAYSLETTVTAASGGNFGSIFIRTGGKGAIVGASGKIPYLSMARQIEAGLVGITAEYMFGGPNAMIMVRGLPLTTIDWRISVRVVRQLF